MGQPVKTRTTKKIKRKHKLNDFVVVGF